MAAPFATVVPSYLGGFKHGIRQAKRFKGWTNLDIYVKSVKFCISWKHRISLIKNLKTPNTRHLAENLKSIISFENKFETL